MKKEQELAIKNMDRALKRLSKADILICGMDDELLYATNKAVKKHREFFPDRSTAEGDYCRVARVVQYDEPSGESGKFEAKCYQDSGGW